jgi:hypothetical protein
MMELDGVVEHHARERGGVATTGIEAQPLLQFRCRMPLDDRARFDLLDVVEESVDELVSQPPCGVIKLHAAAILVER